MPNVLMFDSELSPTARLVGCHLIGLCGNTGQCHPRNKYIAGKFNLQTRQVTNIISELGGYFYAGTDERGRRFLALTPDLYDDEGGSKKLLGGTQKIATHSNINSNKKEEYTSETLAEIERVYKAWLVYWVIGPDRDPDATMDERKAALDAAAKKFRLTPKRKAAIELRLRDAGADMIVRAIKKLGNAGGFYRGENDRDWTADLVEYLLRTYEQVEKWANKE